MNIIKSYIVISIFFLVSCSTSPNLPNVDNIDVAVDFIRFDNEIRTLDLDNLETSFNILKEKYPAYSALMFSSILPLQKESNLDVNILQEFLKHSFTRNALDTIADIFPALKQEEKELRKSLQYFLHYFPEEKLPRFFTSYSDFAYQSYIFDDDEGDGIGISLDLFLGENYPYKSIDPKNPAFSNYITRRYDRKFMVRKIMELLIDEQLGILQGKRFVDHMIHQGKKWYILKQIMPQAEMDIISEFTKDQFTWCEENEKGIWSYVLENNLLYESNQQQIKTYVFESPNSKGMPKEAPGRTAHYLGWKVIEKYMDETKSSISDLIREKDNQKILKLSKYKPKRK